MSQLTGRDSHHCQQEEGRKRKNDEGSSSVLALVLKTKETSTHDTNHDQQSSRVLLVPGDNMRVDIEQKHYNEEFINRASGGCTTIQAMDTGPETRGVCAAATDGDGRGYYPRKQFKSVTKFAAKETNLKTSTKENMGIVEKDMTLRTTDSSHHGEEDRGYGPAQSPDDDAGEVRYPRIQNVTVLTSIHGRDGNDAVGSEQDDDHDDSHDEADENANNNLVQEDATPSTTFPQHLMDAIEQESQHDKPVTILDWVEGGNAFLIRDKDAFETIVLPKYFDRGGVNKCKFMSFVRKLYRWGFRQVVEKAAPPTSMIFMHPNFIRGDKQRCLLMRSIVKRPSSVGSSTVRKQSSSPPPQHAGLVHVQQQEQGQGHATVISNVPMAVSLAQQPTTMSVFPAAFGSIALRSGREQLNNVTPGMALQIAIPHTASINHLQNLVSHYRLNYHPSSSTYVGASSSSSAPPEGFQSSSIGSLQHEYFERLERLLVQQRQQEIVRQILSVSRIGSNGWVTNTMPAAFVAPPRHIHHVPLPSGPPAPDAMGSPPSASVGYHTSASASDFAPGRRTTTDNSNHVHEMMDMQVVVLASQIMKSSPSMEPSRALELAKKSLMGRENSGSSVN